jgi:hypothetical protein
MKLKIKKEHQSTLSEWIGCGLTGTCDDVLASTGEPTRIVPLAKQQASCQWYRT